MRLQETIRELKIKLDKVPPNLEERTTEAYMVEPFLMGLGYDTRKHEQVRPQYLADPHDKKTGKVDYAILRNDKPVIYVEGKRLGENLDAHYNQIKRYFNNTIEVDFAVLTNGNEYRFYTDLINKNHLDKKPFLTFKISHFDWSLIPSIEQFSREQYNPIKLKDSAYKIFREKKIVDYLKRQKTNPDDTFISFITKTVFNTRREAIQQLVKEFIPKGFLEIESKPFIDSEPKPIPDPPPPKPNPPKPSPSPPIPSPDEPINIFDIKVLSYIRPNYIIFENQKKEITNWRYILEYLMKILLERDVSGISRLHENSISKSKKWHESRDIGHGYYIEVNKSAKDILSVIKKSLDHLNLKDALYISIRYTRPPKN